MSEEFRKEVNSKLKKNIIAKGNEILELPRIPTGSLSLDVETGGGIPMGRISYIVGEWSSGKTAVTLKIAAEFQKLWPASDIYWIDAEGVWDPKWAKALGLDPEKVYVVRPEYGEQAYNIALGAIDNGAGLVVIDSVASLASKSEIEENMDKIHVAPMARVNSKFLRKMSVSFNDSGLPPTLIYLNQFRQNVSGYGPPLIEPGGEALNFYPSLKIVLKKGMLFDGKQEYTSVKVDQEGVEVKAQAIKFYTEKNKTAPFKRRGHFWFYFDTLDKHRVKGSYDRLEEMIRYGMKYNVIQWTKGSSWMTYKGEKFQKSKLASFLRLNPEEWFQLEELITKLVLEDMNDRAQSMAEQGALEDELGEESSKEV